jgi:hypothetical protein
MTQLMSRGLRLLMLALLLVSAAVQPAAAQSVLRDSETELLFKDISWPLIEAAGLDPANVKVVLLRDDEINAFVAGGQIVYLHSGLLTSADNVNQLQGVIAHELGHVAGGHSIRMQSGAGEATGSSIATLVLGALAVAAGPGGAGMGLARWRKGDLAGAAAEVIARSGSGLSLAARGHPELLPKAAIVPWGVPPLARACAPGSDPRAPLRVAIVGVVATVKGHDRLSVFLDATDYSPMK